MVIEIEDKGQRHGLVVRRGVCEFERDAAVREGDLMLRISHTTWAALYVGQTTLAKALESGAAHASDDTAVQAFLDLFDTPQEASGVRQ